MQITGIGQVNGKLIGGGIMNEGGNSRRSFFQKAAAVIGMFAAAGYTTKKIFNSTADDRGERANYANDAAMQERAIMGNHLVVMSESEKSQRLQELLNFHNQEIS